MDHLVAEETAGLPVQRRKSFRLAFWLALFFGSLGLLYVTYDVEIGGEIETGTFDRVLVMLRDGQPVEARIYDFKTERATPVLTRNTMTNWNPTAPRRP